MSANPKPPRNPGPENSQPEKPENLTAEFSNLFLKGVKRAADMQKQSLDAAAQQNAETMETYKKSSPPLPGGNIFELAGQAFDRYVEAQKNVIDQVVQQTAAMVETSKERSTSASNVANEFTRMIQDSIERAVTMQKKAIDVAAQQARDMSTATKQQLGIAGTPLEAAADSFQRGIDAAVESHKEMLDAATKPLKPKS